MGGCPPRSGTAAEASHPTEMRGALAHLLAHLATKADSGMRPAAMLELHPRRGQSQARAACSAPGALPLGTSGDSPQRRRWACRAFCFVLQKFFPFSALTARAVSRAAFQSE